MILILTLGGDSNESVQIKCTEKVIVHNAV